MFQMFDVISKLPQNVISKLPQKINRYLMARHLKWDLNIKRQ